MTYVEGVPVDHGDALRAAGHDLTELVRIGARAWIEGALVHGLFHGDVHAGNLFVTPDGKVAFLDFGIMGRLDERTRAVLRRTLPAVMIEGDYRVGDGGGGRPRRASTARSTSTAPPTTWPGSSARSWARRSAR